MSYTEIANKVRNAILATDGELDCRCALASNLVMRLVEGGTIVDGMFNGNQHFWVLVETEEGAVVFDATAEQFGAEGVYVGPLTEDYEIRYLLSATEIESSCDDEACWAQVAA